MSVPRLLHTAEDDPCPLVAVPDDYHLEGRCEDCEIVGVARLSLDRAIERYDTGRLTQALYEAYRYCWATSVYRHGHDADGWRRVPEDPEVRRIARKLYRRIGQAPPVEILDTVRT